jgi:23S rRNA (guanosine2251-2'-O)-methyltransferase
MAKETVLIYGKHSVEEALRVRPAAVRAVYAEDATARSRMKAHTLSPDVLAELGEVNHQGYAARVELPEQMSLDAFLAAYPVSPDSALVVMGELQDPHNVGAIIRSAAAFGIAGILLPEHRQAGITQAVAKVSAGTVFSIPLVSIGNVNQTLARLKEAGYWVYGLAGEGDHPLTKERFDAPAVFVVGSEGAGLREKTREHCDILLSIPMHPRCESLNASAAAAVVLSHWSAQHPGALR